MRHATLAGIHHVTLNVQDVEKSERWYSDVLGFVRLAQFDTDDFQRVIMLHAESGVIVGLNRHHAPQASEPFDERRSGLDHLAFLVPDREALDAWVDRFAELSVLHSDVKPAAIPGSFLVAFRDPDNLQLEMFSPVAAEATDPTTT